MFPEDRPRSYAQELTWQDSILRDYREVLQYPDADPRDVGSVQNWVDGTGSIAREESRYLSHVDDLASMANHADRAVNCVDIAVEDVAQRFGAFVRKVY